MGMNSAGWRKWWNRVQGWFSRKRRPTKNVRKKIKQFRNEKCNVPKEHLE